MILTLFREINWTVVLLTLAVLGGIAVVFGVAIVYISKVFAIKEDTRVTEILGHLPNANCGGCGYPGCAGFAAALLEGKAKTGDCGQVTSAAKSEINNILGVESDGDTGPTVAVVACSGGNKCQDKCSYQGYGDCVSQSSLAHGRKACAAGCMGSGSCAYVCPTDAITLKDGVAAVTDELCISCGVCIQTCPKKIIKRMPKEAKVYLACSSLERGKDVSSVCSAGCIGCGLCQKACNYGAIIMKNNVPVFDYSKCTACLACAQKCPRKVIRIKD